METAQPSSLHVLVMPFSYLTEFDWDVGASLSSCSMDFNKRRESASRAKWRLGQSWIALL
jgi:hypothetical protein